MASCCCAEIFFAGCSALSSCEVMSLGSVRLLPIALCRSLRSLSAFAVCKDVRRARCPRPVRTSLLAAPLNRLAAPGRHSVQACKRLFALCVKRRLQAFSSCPPFTSIGWGQGYAPPPHFLSAGATCKAVSGRHYERDLEQPPALLFGGRSKSRSPCPPFTSIGWGQGYAPPPHFLSAGAMIRVYHRKSNVHRGLRWVAPPAPPLLRVVCSASVVAASSRLPAVECRPRPVALSLLPPTIPPPTPPVPPSHTPRGDNNRLGHYLSAGASNCGARLRPRPPL